MKYLSIGVLLSLEKSIFWKNIPTLYLRSILGAQLKKLACIQGHSNCELCFLKESCPYAYLFESFANKKIPGLEGRNRAIHPFMLRHGQIINNGREYEFSITIIGNAIKYTPYLLVALQEAGKIGIFSSRIHFNPKAIRNRLDNSEISTSSISGLNTATFNFDADIRAVVGKYRIEFESPARIKHMGRFTVDFDPITFWTSIHRRLSILSTLYCDEYIPRIDTEIYKRHAISNRSLVWKDMSRFSSRQKAKMELGGALGSFVIEGPMRASETSLLEAGRLFQIGKNTAFGLGAMKYSKI